MIEPLAASELEDALQTLKRWSYDPKRKALYRLIELDNFSEAFALMVRIALEAERVDHHPEWSNVYKRLEIWLTTHDADGVSERDLTIARFIDTIASR